MKTCPKCNTQLSDDAMFCTNCGTSFQNANPQPQQNANPQPQQNAYQNTQQTYNQPVAPVVNVYDHTAEFDPQDVHENKLFALLCYIMGIIGVVIAGRPVSRHLDDGLTLEVNRLCTDGTRNACSMLYAAAWRAARAMGYKRMVTYILESENGASLRASGWKCVGQAGGLRWTGKRRPKADLYPAEMKQRYEINV